MVWNEAVKINGADPDFHRRDLWNAITAGDFPEWELGVQVFDDAFADAFDFDVLDATKLIPEEIVPVRPIGRMVLDRVVDNFFAETEQVAFCTQNIVPGIDFTNDPLLQGRNFSYLDTQLKRLGAPNFTHIPVNAPRCPVAHFQQDGHMAMTNPIGRANYEPNSWGDDGGPREDPKSGLPVLPGRRGRPEAAAAARVVRRPLQPGPAVLPSARPRSSRHTSATRSCSSCRRSRPRRSGSGWSRNLRNVDDDLARHVADGLGFDELPDALEPARAPIDVDTSPALSILATPSESFRGRKLGVLVSPGADAKTLRMLRRRPRPRG